MKTTKYLELPDITIAYRESGTGKPLILLHGNSESKDLFRNYQTRLFPDFRTLALDSRGHGQSRSEDREYSIERFADDVIAFCARLEITEAYVLGFSDGGNVALWLGRKKPELFPKILAVSPNYLVSGLTDGTLALIRAFRRVFVFLGRVGFKSGTLVMKMDLMLRDSGLVADDLRAIRSRVRVLYAEKDMIREDHILEIASLIPEATAEKIPRSTHLSIMGKKAAGDEMREFFRETAKTTTATV